MIKYFSCFLILLLCLISCRPKKDQANHNTYGPKVVEAHGYVVPKDSMAEPKVILVDESKLKKIPLGKPKVVLSNTNIHIAGEPKIVLAGEPIVIIPGQDTFLLPITIQAIDSQFIGDIPVVAIAKDAGMKDHNPQNFRTFGKLQGLKGETINCIIQDEIGNLWFGMGAGGATKYDGKNFTYYNEKEGLTNKGVACILQDNMGNIWFGTFVDGLYKYDGKSFIHYDQKVGFNSNTVFSIIQDKSGNIWVGTKGAGVIKYDGKSFSKFSKKQGIAENTVLSILEDNKGNLWFGTSKGGVSKYDGKSISNFTMKEGLCDNNISEILQDNRGNIWFATYNGVSKFDNKSFYNYTTNEGLCNNFIVSILQDSDGHIWFGSFGYGMSKYDGKLFTTITEKEGLAHNSIWSMLQTKNRDIWFGTSQGVSICGENSFTNYTDAEGLANNYVSSFVEDLKGNLWLGSNSGLSSHNGISFTTFTDGEELSNPAIGCMVLDRCENLWLGTSTGVYKYDGESLINFTDQQGLCHNRVGSILEDNLGNLWFGTMGGMTLYDGKTFTNFTREQGLCNNTVWSTLQDKKGNIWIGTNGGANKYDGKTFTQFSEKEGLCNNFVTSMQQDDIGNIWFGTRNGISMYDGNSFTYFTESEGLSHNAIRCMLQDKSGNLWFGTPFGLNKISKSKFVQIFSKIKLNILQEKDVIFKTYTYEDGLQGIGCNGFAKAIFEAKDSTIWIGTNDRLTAFHPEEEIEDSIGPNLQLVNLELFNENISWAQLAQNKDSLLVLGNGVKISNYKFDGTSRWYGLPENLNLAYNNNNLTFNFIGITMNQPKKVKYQYKLEGNDENWSGITTRTEAPYGNLPPRDYTFKVKAMNSAGYWSNEIHYPFTIRPPWWATWWAYALYVLMGGSIVYTIYQSRIRLLKSKQSAQIKTMVATQEDERKRISRDLHDDVGTKLSALKLTLSALGEKASETHHEEIKSLAASSEEFIKEAMQDVRQLLLNLSPTVLEEFGYTTAVEGLVNKINGTKQIHFNLVVFGMKERLKKEYELALYRITQELINNVIKHARAKHVSLQIGQRDEKIILMIEDDGLGFDVSAHKEGYGLNNLDARTKLMHGTMAIDSHFGKGTSVLIEIPYHLN